MARFSITQPSYSGELTSGLSVNQTPLWYQIPPIHELYITINDNNIDNPDGGQEWGGNGIVGFEMHLNIGMTGTTFNSPAEVVVNSQVANGWQIQFNVDGPSEFTDFNTVLRVVGYGWGGGQNNRTMTSLVGNGNICTLKNLTTPILSGVGHATFTPDASSCLGAGICGCFCTSNASGQMNVGDIFRPSTIFAGRHLPHDTGNDIRAGGRKGIQVPGGGDNSIYTYSIECDYGTHTTTSDCDGFQEGNTGCARPMEECLNSGGSVL